MTESTRVFPIPSVGYSLLSGSDRSGASREPITRRRRGHRLKLVTVYHLGRVTAELENAQQTIGDYQKALTAFSADTGALSSRERYDRRQTLCDKLRELIANNKATTCYLEAALASLSSAEDTEEKAIPGRPVLTTDD